MVETLKILYLIDEVILGKICIDKEKLSSEINLFVDFDNERHMQVAANIILLSGLIKDKNNKHISILWRSS